MEFPEPELEEYVDVWSRQVELGVTGGTMSVLVYEPAGAGAHPAVVIGAEGAGINHFIRCVAATLAHVGFVALVPDYYRGVTMPDPDDYSDIPGMMQMIGALDFRRAAHDFLDTIHLARDLPNVDGKVAVWGYCTGGTVAMFGACLDRSIDAAALFYPSQPRFEVIDARHPAHVIDLVWNIACPVMIMSGERDEIMSSEQLADLEERLSRWGIDHEIRTYPGAGHAFSSPGFANYDPVASEAAWRDGLQFTIDRLRPPSA
ncbi:MAG TPA: dienelactone hydrolase family protein [Acidimicrobiales bacterium]|nr:dienelactone hydrolase family protein [Acidimicrobiales bacterium]